MSFSVVFVGLEQEWGNLEVTQSRNKKIRDEASNLQMKYEALKKFALENRIPLPPELEE